MYNERKERIATFDPTKVEVCTSNDCVLNSVEKNFLKQIIGQPVKNPNVWGYWTYEYSIDFVQIMTKLISYGFLDIGSIENDLEKLTMTELKNVLDFFKLPKSGKKAELIDRIRSNTDITSLQNYFSDKPKIYLLTKKGRKALENLVDSATKNTEFEDQCLELILLGDIDGAYKVICKNEMNKVIPRGLGTDWQLEYKNGLSDYQLCKYTNFLQLNIGNEIPKEIREYEMQFKACCILAILLGITADKIAKTFIRITGKCTKEKSSLRASLQNFQFKLMEDFQSHCFEELMGD